MNNEESLLESDISSLVKSWGFGGDQSLHEHAANVVKYSKFRTGDIVAALGIASKEDVENLIQSKPSEVKTLEYLRQAGLRGLSARADEIMAIQQSRCYVSKAYIGLSVHPKVFEKDEINQKSGFAELHRSELNKYEVIPMASNERLVLLFASFDKMIQFNSLGKSDRLESRLIQALVKIAGGHADTARLYSAVAENQLYIAFQQKLTEAGGSIGGEDESLQTISQADAEREPAIGKIVQVLNLAMQDEVNDVWIEPDTSTRGAIVKFRRDQRMVDSKIRLNEEERSSIERILLSRSKANPSSGTLRRPVDGKLNFDGRFGEAFLRMSFIPMEESKMQAASISMRIFPKTTKKISLESLNIHPDLQEELRYFTRRKHGLFVVCGPTNSGKSTTIGGMLCEHVDMFGASSKRVSVEQPCERVLPGVLHIDVSQHRYNADSYSTEVVDEPFSMALRAILRHDPDVIFVGEVRDKESCMVSIDSANTGHLVFTTTHANDTVLGYRRLASFLDKDRRFDLVNVLEGILAQRLLTLLCSHCSIDKSIDENVMQQFERYAKNKGVNLENYTFPETMKEANPAGCKHCIEGRKGMTPVHGLLTMNPEVRQLLLSENELDWMKAENASSSKFTLFGGSFELFKQGRIDMESVLL